ncbi:response regulator [Candidatus Dojkabacteria bacterium]|uniref:Response regulator n=1 Tax=Candidatus Dojkabacteria bacterium TaxID=2099670 RepID=A0A955L830_9BACT|nr:response regulator [Candidatus Dojkabacteria bacterium]
MNEAKTIKVLLVEDEQDAREIYADILSANGFYVVSAVDGQDAQEKLDQESFDIVLLDIITPRKDGIQTLSEIKANPDTFGTPKVVMLSNIAGDISIDKAMELGADGYMLKSDVEPTDLVNIVRKYFE